LVDRSAQLETFTALWSEVLLGEGQVALVVGEAGIGKSRLVDEFATQHAGDADVVRCGCLHAGGRDMPLAPFRGALAARLPGVQARSWDAGQLLDAFARRLGADSWARPVLLVVEDLHWADATTLAMVDHLGRSLRSSRVFLVLTVRADDLTDSSPVSDEVLELARLPNALRLSLPRLTRDGVIRQMRAILGRPPPAALAESVAARSDGVPFLVEELVAAGLEGRSDVPTQVHDLVRQRTRGLSDAAGFVLRLAATATSGTDEQTLVSLSGLGDVEVTAAARELVDAGLLVVDGSGGLVFRHALVREAVESSLLPREAATLHARYARLLDARAVEDPRAAVEAAHHWWRAGDRPRAFVAALAAADSAHQVGARAEELVLLTRALETFDDRPASQERPDRPALLARTARVALDAGNLGVARDLWESARHEMDTDPDPTWLARNLSEEAGYLLGFGDLPGVEDRLRTLLAQLPPGADAARLYALTGLTWFALHRGESGPSTRALLQEVLDGPVEVFDPGQRVVLHSVAAWLAGREPGGEAEALARFDTARALAESLGDPVPLVVCLNNEADFLIALDRPAEAAALMRRGLELAEQAGMPTQARGTFVHTLVAALLETGEIPEARAVLEDLLKVDLPGPDVGVLYAVLGLVRVRSGEWEEAAEAAATAHARLDGATELAAQSVFPLATLDGELHAAAGEREAALGIAERTCREHGEHVLPSLVWRLLDVAARAAASQPAPAWLLDEVRRQEQRHPRLPARAAAVRAALAGRTEPDRPRPASPDPTFPELTPRELEVLRLVAAGRSNPAIAAQLVISPKTASIHVSHILTKLGLSSRGEAAALAWSRGLVADTPVVGGQSR
jgi:DNA-binding CsgD family transcriptional regulator/tetratricopeptide (TPR) repeat protein